MQDERRDERSQAQRRDERDEGGRSRAQQRDEAEINEFGLTEEEQKEIIRLDEKRKLESKHCLETLFFLWKPELCKGLPMLTKWKRLEVFLRTASSVEKIRFSTYLQLEEKAYDVFERQYKADITDKSFGFEISFNLDHFIVLVVRVDKDMQHHWIGRKFKTDFSWFIPWVEFDFTLRFFPLENPISEE